MDIVPRAIGDFEGKQYHLELYGPNGFYRAFRGNKDTAFVETALTYKSKNGVLTGNVLLEIQNNGPQSIQCAIRDVSYKTPLKTVKLPPNGTQKQVINLQTRHHW